MADPAPSAVAEKGAARPAARSGRRVRAVMFARAAAVAAVILIVDRITKHAVQTGIPVGAVHRFLPAVNLVHVQNTGVAFSLFSGGGALVLALTLAALAALLVYFARRPTRPGLWVPTGLLVGGAIGNLIDRIAHGSVTDFIQLPAWPAFNVSDIAITVGVLALVYVLEGPRSRRGSD